jgi:hypothetical protein
MKECRMEGRCIGLDVHGDFCEVVIWEAGEVRHAPKVAARPGPLEEFARQLGPADRVALEATGMRWRSRGVSSRTSRTSREHAPAEGDRGVQA